MLGEFMPQSESFGIGLAIGGMLWVTAGFSYFSNKTEGYNFLIFPASHFEKWLSVVLLLGLFIIFYCSFFRILDAAYMAHFRNNLDTAMKPEQYKRLYDSAKVMPFLSNNLRYNYLIFFNITGAMAIGALYFNRMALIKTLFVCVGVFAGLEGLNKQLINTIFPLEMHTTVFWRTVHVASSDQFISLPSPFDTLHLVFLNYLLPVALWLIALIRLREKEL